MLDGGGEFHRGLDEVVFAVEVNHDGMGIRQLSPNGSGQAEACRSQATAGDKLSGTRKAIELRRPHLVLPHTRGHDGPALGLSVYLFNHELRFDTGTALVVAEGKRPFPLGNLREPGRSIPQDHLLGQFPQHPLGIAHDRDIRLPVLGNAPRIDVDMDDLRIRGERRRFARDTAIKPGPNGDQEITGLHGVVGIGRPMHSQHVQRFRSTDR